MILVKVLMIAVMMIVMMMFMVITMMETMMATMMVTTMMTMMMSRGNEWVTMASCGIIMGGSALAYTTATIIRFEEEVEVFFYINLLLPSEQILFLSSK